MFELTGADGTLVVGLVLVILVLGGLRFMDEVVDVLASLERDDALEPTEKWE